MGTYGRHAEFRQTPLMEHRLGRYFNGSGDPILQLAPVRVPDAAEVDGNGRLPLELCTGATAPIPTRHGLAVFEWEDADLAMGIVPDGRVINSISDFDLVPVGRPCQLVHGTEVRVAFWSYEASNYDGQRDYPGRVMVPGVIDATVTVENGEYLTPGVGTDDDGYWAVTADAGEAWFVVTNVVPDRGLVEAQMLF